MEITHLNCECYSPEHTLRLVANKREAEMWIDIRLNYYPIGIKGFFRRLKAATLYVLGVRPKDGHFDTFCLSVKEAISFRSVLDDFIRSRKDAGCGQECE